jgi:uncharacterized protein DUF5715
MKVLGSMRIAVLLAAAVLLGIGCRGRSADRHASQGQASPASAAGGATGPPASAPPEEEASGGPASADELEDAIAETEEERQSTEKLSIPAELSLYPDRKRFLAIQIADAEGERYTRPHDLAALAQLIQKGEVVVLPALGADYVLDDVGEDAHENPLSHYDVAANREVPLFADAAAEKAGLSGLGTAQRAAATAAYGNPETAQMLFAEHAAITSLARTLEGGPYDLSDPPSVARFQGRIMSSLRPQARQTLLALAKAYHDKYERLLPIVSLIRTERYQRRLAHVNPNATHVAIAPHTTGEAFDITYRYMATDEQNFVMQQIAQLESAGRVEATRERRNCFHVFTFADGRRPGEAAIASAREETSPEASVESSAVPRKHTRKPAARTARAARAARAKASTRAAARAH